MNCRHRKSLLLLVLLLWSREALADEVVGAWSPRDVPGVTQQAIAAAGRLGVAEILKRNPAVDSWPDAFLLMAGAYPHREDRALLEGLVAQLGDPKRTGLRETNRLIIWERIISGEIRFEGLGFQVSDDLFGVAGRANWMLRNLTKKDFGHVRPNTSAEELDGLRRRWARWLAGERVEEHRDVYAPAGEDSRFKRGVTGPETVEALIVSLRPRAGKQNVAGEGCAVALRALYPSGPTAPAEAACSPDAFARGYLAALTGVREPHDHAWWQRWWDANKGRLSWDAEKGMFVAGK